MSRARRRLHSTRRALGLLAGACALGVLGAPCVRPYGLKPTAAVGPFLDGAFPSRRPQGNLGFTIAEAFPSLSGIPPTALVIVPNPADDRIYVAARDGQMVSFPNDAAATSAVPFMDLRDRVAMVEDGGFLGMVFHPEFGQPGSPYELAFYAYYNTYCPANVAGDAVDLGACNPGYPQTFTLGFFDTWMRLSRFQAYWDPVDGVYKGDPASESPMINMRHYNSAHSGGGLLIDDDHDLFLSIGDQFRYTTAQDIATQLEGGVHRIAIDVVPQAGGSWSCPAGSHLPRRHYRGVTGNPDEMSGRLYCIPDDNPFLDPGGGLFEEYYSLGHRNPHRLTLDRATGRLWSGEVGELTRDEINVIEKGHNYGWPFREGLVAGQSPPPSTIVGILTDPVIDFTRDEAATIIGGYVYRGTRLPELFGRFIAGDYTTRNVFAIDLDPGTMTATKELLTTFAPGGLATFGEDNGGELLLGSVFPGVGIHRLERVGQGPGEPPPFLSQTGAFDDLAALDAHDGGVPFEPLSFWSDGARKRRFVFVPNDGTRDEPDEQVGFSETGNWSFPLGTVFMKHFELPLFEAQPDVTTRLETRFLVHGEDGWYGVTYRWNATQTDARLLETSETADYTIATEGGGSRVQTWTFPSRSECITCHNPNVGGPAGPRTAQLNRPFVYPPNGVLDNQLRSWNHVGLFSPPLVESQIPALVAAKRIDEASASLELRARSYLDTNCSYCHRPGPGNPADFDARLVTPLAQQGLVWGAVSNAFGIPDPYLVKPGVPSSSLVYHRAGSLGAAGMPPLAKSLVDDDGVALLAEWIERIDPGSPHPGLGYEYFETGPLTSLPNFDALVPVRTGTVSAFDISPRDRDDDFAFRFSGVVNVPSAGSWTFFTSSDEGSRLFVDGSQVVNNDGLHPTTEASGTIALAAGYHDIVVTMFEALGPQSLTVSWQGPAGPKLPIAPDVLFREQPSAGVNQPPTLALPAWLDSTVGEGISLQPSASDPDGDSLYFSAEGLPAGLAIDPLTGLIQGTLGPGSVGARTVVVGVSDGPASASRSLWWVVLDGGAPTVAVTSPAGGAVLSGMATLRATASDDVGVLGVQFLVDGAPVGAEDTAPPYEAAWNTATLGDGLHQVSARARDADGKTALAPDVGVVLDNAVLRAPVAAWAFDETAGTVATDASGNGHDGSIAGAQRTPSGHSGGALVFDGSGDVVTVPDAGALDLASAMTLAAWVRPEAIPSYWSAVLQKDPSVYHLHASSPSGRPASGVTASAGCCSNVIGPAPLAVGTWSHLASTYDGSQARLYVNGALVASATALGPIQATSGSLRIGNNTFAGEAFTGSIDDARVYDVVLAAHEIEALMQLPVLPVGADTDPPAVALTAPASGAVLAGPVALSASATDGVGVAGVEFLLDGSALGPEDTAAPYELSWQSGGAPNGAHVLAARARDASGNAATSTGVPVTVANPSDLVPPTVTLTAPAEGSVVAGAVTLRASAADNLAVAGVRFLLDGQPLGSEDTLAPYELVWSTGTVADGPYALSARARDAAGNSADAVSIGVTVENAGGPVAAWAFDEGAGTSAGDATGNGHTGAVTGAAWTVSGRHGGALSFDGLDDAVVVPEDGTFQLGSTLTVSAWVYRLASAAGWWPVVQKEPDVFLLHAGSPSGGAVAAVTANGGCCASAFAPSVAPADTWTHLAMTYDGAQVTLYLNGVSAASAPASGPVAATASPLWIGNNAYAGEAFRGSIDDVRIYDRVLSPAEIAADMIAPVGP